MRDYICPDRIYTDVKTGACRHGPARGDRAAKSRESTPGQPPNHRQAASWVEGHKSRDRAGLAAHLALPHARRGGRRRAHLPDSQIFAAIW